MFQCSICSDLFDGVINALGAPCGHVFHSTCLSKWFGMSQTCPECRNNFLEESCFDISFNMSYSKDNNPIRLYNQVEHLKAAVQEKIIKSNNIERENDALRERIAFRELDVDAIREEHRKLEHELVRCFNIRKALIRAVLVRKELRSEIMGLKRNQRFSFSDLDITIFAPKNLSTEMENADISNQYFHVAIIASIFGSKKKHQMNLLVSEKETLEIFVPNKPNVTPMEFLPIANKNLESDSFSSNDSSDSGRIIEVDQQLSAAQQL